jgi:hypothetical protein
MSSPTLSSAAHKVLNAAWSSDWESTEVNVRIAKAIAAAILKAAVIELNLGTPEDPAISAKELLALSQELTSLEGNHQ